MLFLELFFLCQSKIPPEFTNLAQRALDNARVKTPKELRENTLHPGFYESPDFQYRLKKSLTCTNTNDVKGFARNEKHIAIVKRKNFNLKDGFVLVDQESQKLYQLKKSVASDNKVEVYESKEVTIFDVFTDFKIHKTTWQGRKYRPVNDSFRSTKDIIPLKEEYNVNWDKDNNQPQMQQIGETDLSFGYGAYASLEAEFTYSFTNPIDVKLAANVALTACVGAKFVIPDNFQYDFDPIKLIDKDISIPNLAFDSKILKLVIKIGAFFNLQAELNDMKFKIPVGFTYYKGYKFCGSKSVLITPTIQNNDPWKFTFTDLADENDSPSLLESLSSASFTGVVEASLNMKLTIKIGTYVDATVKFGAGIPFEYTLGFDQTNCLFPHLSLSFKIPLKALLLVDPIKVKIGFFDHTIFKGGKMISIMRTFEFGPFCMAPNLQVAQFIKNDQGSNEVSFNVDQFEFYPINEQTAPTETILTITYDTKYSGKYMLLQSSSFDLSIPKSIYIDSTTQMVKLDEQNIKIVCRPKADATKAQIVGTVAEALNNFNPLGTGEIIEYTISANTKFLFYTPSIEKTVFIAFTSTPNFRTGVPVNDDTIFIMITYTQNPQYSHHFFYYATLFITDGQDSLTFDFNNLKAIPEKITEIESFQIKVVCYNAKEIIMTGPNGKTLTEVVDQTSSVPHAIFTVNFADFPDLLLTFTPVCKDETGMMCQLTLEPSEADGYQVIKYPNSEGISLTGQGFLAEAIPVENGKSYNYYKTYEESISKGKFYPKNTNIKIVPSVTTSLNSKSVCIKNAADDTDILPFSRKYFNDNFEDVLGLIANKIDALTIDDISSDENGCLVFPTSAELKDITYLPKEICDIPIQQYGEKPIEECVVDTGMDHCSECEFASDGKTKECTSCDSTDYEVSTDKTKCVQIIKECVVDTGMDHCSECKFASDGKTKECTSCDSTDYEVSTDKTKCVQKIVTSCIEVTEYPYEYDCVKCNNDKTLCEQCSNSNLYMPDENGECIRKCVVGQDGCAECSEDGKKCTKCMDNEHLVLDKYSEYGCTCEGEYEFVNNKCLASITSITPTPLPNLESFPAGSSTPDANNIQTIDTAKITNFDATKIYKEDMAESAVQLNIINKNNANLYVVLPNSDKEAPIVPENENTKVTLQFPSMNSFSIQLKNGASTTINTDVSTATINGVKDDTATEVAIGKVVPGKDLTLETDKTLLIKELQIFGKKEINAEENKVKIEKVKVEQGGSFEPSENLQIQNVEIGVHSSLTFNKACKDANIVIYYNRPHGDKSSIPLSTNEEEVTDIVPKSLTIKRKEVDLLLDEEDFLIYVGLYYPEMEDKVKSTCNKWNEVYDNSDSPFNTVQCKYNGPYKSDDGEIYKVVSLYGTNIEEKKKGLSGGAIAGIVIACVVVVGVAVGLCLYFFVFKKSAVANSSSQ